MIEQTDTILGADPDKVIVVAFNEYNTVVGERSGISGLVLEYFEVVAIVTVQAIIGAEPHKAVIVLVNAGNCVVG